MVFDYSQTSRGNFDQHTAIIQDYNVLAKYVRFTPTGHYSQKSMRMELYGWPHGTKSFLICHIYMVVYIFDNVP